MREDNSKKTKNDIILIASLLLVVTAVVACLWLFGAKAEVVVVKIDGETVSEYSLDEDREVEIKSGDGYNILIIEDGKARVERASCPDGICSEHRPISRGGESIICLPNKVVLEVHASGNDEPDIIT